MITYLGYITTTFTQIMYTVDAYAPMSSIYGVTQQGRSLSNFGIYEIPISSIEWIFPQNLTNTWGKYLISLSNCNKEGYSLKGRKIYNSIELIPDVVYFINMEFSMADHIETSAPCCLNRNWFLDSLTGGKLLTQIFQEKSRKTHGGLWEGFCCLWD